MRCQAEKSIHRPSTALPSAALGAGEAEGAGDAGDAEAEIAGAGLQIANASATKESGRRRLTALTTGRPAPTNRPKDAGREAWRWRPERPPDAGGVNPSSFEPEQAPAKARRRQGVALQIGGVEPPLPSVARRDEEA